MMLCYRTLYKPGELGHGAVLQALYKPGELGHGAVLQDPYTNLVKLDIMLCYRTLYKPGEPGHGAVLQALCCLSNCLPAGHPFPAHARNLSCLPPPHVTSHSIHVFHRLHNVPLGPENIHNNCIIIQKNNFMY